MEALEESKKSATYDKARLLEFAAKHENIMVPSLKTKEANAALKIALDMILEAIYLIRKRAEEL